MQEELAARKAASEHTAKEGLEARVADAMGAVRDVPRDVPDAEYRPADDRARGHFERSGQKRNPVQMYLAERSGNKTARRAVIASAVFVLIVIFASLGVALIGNMVEDDPDPWETDPTEWTEPTEGRDPTEGTQSSRPAYPPKGELGKRSTMVDIEEYVAKRTKPLKDEQILFGSAYLEIDTEVDKDDSENNWYVSEGRIYIWATCDEADDPAKTLKRYTRLNDSVKKVLKENDLEETPVIIAVHVTDSWYLQLLLIDGNPEFNAGESDH